MNGKKIKIFNFPKLSLYVKQFTDRPKIGQLGIENPILIVRENLLETLMIND